MFVRIGHRYKRRNADCDQQQENTENTAEHNPDNFAGAHALFGRHGRVNRVGRRRGISPLPVSRLPVRRLCLRLSIGRRGLGLPVKLLTVRRRGLRLSVWRLPVRRRGLRLSVWCLPVRRHRSGIRYGRHGARRIRRWYRGRGHLFFRRYRIRRTRLGIVSLHRRFWGNGRLFRRNRLCAFLRCRGLFGLLCHKFLHRRYICRIGKIILKICHGNPSLSFFSIIVQDFAFAVNTRFGLSIWAVCRNIGAFVVFPGKV